jgi:hypothetical protein
MADLVHAGGWSQEQVAYMLLERVAYVENKPLHGTMGTTADRKWVLETYAECLSTVKSPSLKWKSP